MVGSDRVYRLVVCLLVKKFRRIAYIWNKSKWHILILDFSVVAGILLLNEQNHAQLHTIASSPPPARCPSFISNLYLLGPKNQYE